MSVMTNTEYRLFNDLLQAGWQNEELREALQELVEVCDLGKPDEFSMDRYERAMQEAKRVLNQKINWSKP